MPDLVAQPQLLRHVQSEHEARKQEGNVGSGAFAREKTPKNHEGPARLRSTGEAFGYVRLGDRPDCSPSVDHARRRTARETPGCPAPCPSASYHLKACEASPPS